MQNKRSGQRNDHQLRRAQSLEMSSPESVTTSSAAIHVNPLFESGNNETLGDRNSSVRRHNSEPARSRYRIINSIVDRSESIKTGVMKGTQEFFGINGDKQSNDVWNQRRQRYFSNYGKIKPKDKPIPLRTQMMSSTGFDETDGDFQSNKMNGFTDEPQEYDLSPEDTSRRHALKVTFKALSLASNALLNKFSNRREEVVSDGSTDLTHSVATYRVAAPLGPQTAFYSQAVPYAQAETTSADAEPEPFFFKTPKPIAEEVDGRPQKANKWKIQRQVSVKKELSFHHQIIQGLLRTDNSNRREYGLGFIGRLLSGDLKKGLTKEEQKALDHIDDFRPFFTYWITIVQILVLIITLSTYGFGYFGFGSAHVTGLVYVESLSLQQVDYNEQQNFWIGPRYADLIHLGAKYTPCMRRDEKIYDIIKDQRKLENSSGCCIRNDDSGCVQTFEDKCSPLLSTWHKWSLRDIENPLQRTSGPVCGQDPRFCEQPASIEPYDWADDITQWPICRKKSKPREHYEKHMKCELIARPCCVGVYGMCHITTREHCSFINGFFHEEATLCSQVSCMQDLCGMIKFYSNDSPDQFYRIWTPIFLHAGLGHILITVLFQYFIMRDIEKLTGYKRMAIIYFGSGIAGYLASAVLVPFRPEVGPAGSLYGVLACLFVELINMWSYIENPFPVLFKLLAIVVFLFGFGLLPMVDNFAHMIGFVIGFLLSMALMPYLEIDNKYNRRQKVIKITVCLLTVAVIVITLFVLLYNVPIYNIGFLKYFNCIGSSEWCANQDIQIKSILI